MRFAKLKKRPNQVALVRDAQGFLRSFETETGQSVLGAVAAFVPEREIASVLAVGSIPLGIATSVSDIDLLVVLRRRLGVQEALRSFDDIVFAVSDNASGSVIASNIVASMGGLEVDLMFVVLPELYAALRNVETAPPSEGAMIVLSRIKTGWELYNAADVATWREPFVTANALDVRSAVAHFVAAVKHMEDAKAAVCDNLMLAVYLARESISAAFRAHLASRGIAFSGAKWLRLVSKAPPAVPRQSPTMLADGMRLLMHSPTLTETAVAAHMLAVEAFLGQVREEITSTRTLQLAFLLCPQIPDD